MMTNDELLLGNKNIKISRSKKNMHNAAINVTLVGKKREAYCYNLDSIAEKVVIGLQDGTETTVNVIDLKCVDKIIKILEENRNMAINYRHLGVYFESSYLMFFVDKFTISILEYILLAYREKYRIRVYLYCTIGLEHTAKGINLYDLYDEEKGTLSGYVCNQPFQGALFSSVLTSPFLSGVFCEHLEEERNYYKKMFFLQLNDFEYKELRQDRFDPGSGFRRLRRIYSGNKGGSQACDDCEAFLENYELDAEDIDNVITLLFELIPNALEHGRGDCLLDIDATPIFEEYVDGRKLSNVIFNMTIFNFSEKLLWTDIIKKVKNENQEKYTNQSKLLEAARHARNFHEKYFVKDDDFDIEAYFEEDFNNVLCFQKISGRSGDRSSGGKGLSIVINTLLENTNFNQSYVLSGHNCVFLKREYLERNRDGYVGFNESNDFISDIPNIKECIGHTNFYMPGVAYNFTFAFKSGGKEYEHI